MDRPSHAPGAAHQHLVRFWQSVVHQRQDFSANDKQELQQYPHAASVLLEAICTDPHGRMVDRAPYVGEPFLACADSIARASVDETDAYALRLCGESMMELRPYQDAAYALRLCGESPPRHMDADVMDRACRRLQSLSPNVAISACGRSANTDPHLVAAMVRVGLDVPPPHDDAYAYRVQLNHERITPEHAKTCMQALAKRPPGPMRSEIAVAIATICVLHADVISPMDWPRLVAVAGSELQQRGPKMVNGQVQGLHNGPTFVRHIAKAMEKHSMETRANTAVAIAKSWTVPVQVGWQPGVDGVVSCMRLGGAMGRPRVIAAMMENKLLTPIIGLAFPDAAATAQPIPVRPTTRLLDATIRHFHEKPEDIPASMRMSSEWMCSCEVVKSMSDLIATRPRSEMPAVAMAISDSLAVPWTHGQRGAYAHEGIAGGVIDMAAIIHDDALSAHVRRVCAHDKRFMSAAAVKATSSVFQAPASEIVPILRTMMLSDHEHLNADGIRALACKVPLSDRLLLLSELPVEPAVKDDGGYAVGAIDAGFIKDLLADQRPWFAGVTEAIHGYEVDDEPYAHMHDDHVRSVALQWPPQLRERAQRACLRRAVCGTSSALGQRMLSILSDQAII